MAIVIIMLALVVVVVVVSMNSLAGQLAHEVREYLACLQCCFIGKDIEEQKLLQYNTFLCSVLLQIRQCCRVLSFRCDLASSFVSNVDGLQFCNSCPLLL